MTDLVLVTISFIVIAMMFIVAFLRERRK